MIPIRKFTLTAFAILSLGLAGCSASTEDDSATTADTAASLSTPESETSSESTTVVTTTEEDPTPETTVEEESSPNPSIDATADAGPILVDPARFSMDGPYVFDYATQSGETGTCLLTPDGATCTGVPAADVPDITYAPFAGQRPGAVSASMGGIHYTILEGVPPAPAQLQPGEKLVVDATTCEVSQTRDVTCVSGDTSFTVSGADRSITTG